MPVDVWIRLVVLVALLLGALFALAWSWPWFVRTFGGPDVVAEELIARNKAKPRAGMEQVDWTRVNRLGRRRWEQTLAAQRGRFTVVTARQGAGARGGRA